MARTHKSLEDLPLLPGFRGRGEVTDSGSAERPSRLSLAGADASSMSRSSDTSAADRLVPGSRPGPLATRRASRSGLERLARQRVYAGVLDLLIHVAALAVLLATVRLLGLPLSLADWPAYALTMVNFSFFYHVFSLLFWAATPGMQEAGLVVSGGKGESLTLWQALGRWLAAAGTAALLGLPALALAWRGSSAADWISGSAVLEK